MNGVFRVIGIGGVITSALVFGGVLLKIQDVGMEAARNGNIESVGQAIVLMLLVVIAVLIIQLASPR